MIRVLQCGQGPEKIVHPCLIVFAYLIFFRSFLILIVILHVTLLCCCERKEEMNSVHTHVILFRHFVEKSKLEQFFLR
jgi:hypothetical protein